MDWLKKILNYKGDFLGAAYFSDLKSNNHSLWLNYNF